MTEIKTCTDMTIEGRSKYIRLVCIAGLIILADQLTKLLILNNLALHHSITIIPGFFDITHVHNPGGAFGFLADQSSTVRATLFLFVSSLAICFIFYFYKNTPGTHPFLAAGLAMILGGAVGNLIDRIRLGEVVDFLYFYVNDMHWPAFNIADSAISVGMTIFVFHIIFKKMPA